MPCQAKVVKFPRKRSRRARDLLEVRLAAAGASFEAEVSRRVSAEMAEERRRFNETRARQFAQRSECWAQKRIDAAVRKTITIGIDGLLVVEYVELPFQLDLPLDSDGDPDE